MRDGESKKRRGDLRSQFDRLRYTSAQRPEGFRAKDIRRKIKARHRDSAVAPQAMEEIRYRRDLPRRSPPPSSQPIAGRHVVLEESTRGSEVLHGTRGRHFVVQTQIDDVDGEGDLAGRFKSRLALRDCWLKERLGTVCESDTVAPGDFIFMDVESTGLSNATVFLIGCMVWRDEGFHVQQLLARNYAEEAAIVASFLDHCRDRKVLVTFNGKTFDFPFVRARSAANGIPFDLQLGHFDLLHECRRVWRKRLRDCKLQTLESQVCRRPRSGDIPGAEIPDAYHDFVRTGNAWRMVAVLRHNLLDLVTLADLMTRFPRRLAK